MIQPSACQILALAHHDATILAAGWSSGTPTRATDELWRVHTYFSFVIPVTALSYVLGALGGAFFLGERVDSQRWIGVLFVCTGVALVFVGGR
jgi:drug/metabolite transporter (DMT)-like permease